jgi:hypothetical protein
MKLEFSQQIFDKGLNIKFHQNPSSGSRVVACERTGMKLTVGFRNFANALKKETQNHQKTETYRNHVKQKVPESIWEVTRPA